MQLDNLTNLIVCESDSRILESYRRKQHELSTQIDQINANIDVKRRENKISAESIKYFEKLITEAEKAVDQMEDLITNDRFDDVNDVVIPTIFSELEKLESYEVKKEVLEAVISPEQGGCVKMAYDTDEKIHYVKVDAKLNYLRTARIIEALKNSTLADGSFYNPNYSILRL